MIDGSEKRNRQLGFELQNSHVCEKRSNSHMFLCRGNCFARLRKNSLPVSVVITSVKIDIFTKSLEVTVHNF